MNTEWIVERRILVDLADGQTHRDCKIRVGRRIGLLFPGGPRGPVEEVVEIYDSNHQLISRFEHPPPKRSQSREVLAILIDAGAVFRDAGIHPRIAAMHPDFEVTGLSWPKGWVDGQVLGLFDDVRTAPPSGGL